MRLVVVPDVNNMCLSSRLAAAGVGQGATTDPSSSQEGRGRSVRTQTHKMPGGSADTLCSPSRSFAPLPALFFPPPDAVSSSSPRSLGSAPLGSPHPPPFAPPPRLPSPPGDLSQALTASGALLDWL